MGVLQLFYNDFQERGSWKKSFLLVFLVVQYIIWVLIVTICSIDNQDQNQSGSNSSPSSGSSSSSSSTSPSSMVLLLPYPLAIYAWSIGQSFTTLGILTPFSTLLTKKSWESFDYRFAAGNNDDNDNNDNVVLVLPPMEIPILNVQDYYSHNNQDNDDDEDASGVIRAKSYLENTYGKDWIERPLLLKGLWTQRELLEGNNENHENNENDSIHHRKSKKRKRLLTPNGLLTMTNLTIPYFTNATNPTALIPDGSDTVSNIVKGMIYEQKPYKIGSQYIVQNDPTLLVKEIIPNDNNDNNQLFLTKLFGNHFSPEKITGHSLFEFKNGIKLKLPGTTTVPVFIANTITVSKDKDEATTATTTQKNEECRSSRSSSSSTLLSNTNENDDTSSCKNTDNNNNNNNSHKNDQEEDDDQEEVDDQEEEVDEVPPITNPVLTGLHCEPIANLAVQLWGSRTWTLVNPIHSWKLRPRIATDGRSYYPSSISQKDLTRKIPRYSITTNPGDAVWLPTWTYHQVEYTTTTSKMNANDNDEDDDEKNENYKIILSQLSIGASIFHFRPYDYIRRNPLFALLLIPSLLKELIGMKTQ